MPSEHGLRFTSVLSLWDKPSWVQEAQDWMTAIRRPPRLIGHGLRKGLCRFCAGEIRAWNGTRHVLKLLSWHPECVILNEITKNPIAARVKVFARDQGICAGCGTDTKPHPCPWPETSGWEDVLEHLAEIDLCRGFFIGPLGPWELDHIHPLWLVDREAPDAMKYWLLGNMQTLCAPCHKSKTATEAATRAKCKRIVADHGLTGHKDNAQERAQAKRGKKGLPF